MPELRDVEMIDEEKDRVLLVDSEWVRNSERKWIFMPDNLSKQQRYIPLHAGMKMSHLLTGVSDQIQETCTGSKLRLSYQYPEWIAADGGGMDMPQYITDNSELGVFIELRRSIEAVNLFVSISSTDGSEDKTTAEKVIGNDGGGTIEDEEWHKFAMDKKGDVEEHSIPRNWRRIEKPQTHSIPATGGGIAITEPVWNIRPWMESEATIGKGKKMRVETDSDSDSDDDMLVPVFRTPVDVSGRGKRPMWSRLIFGIPGIPNTVVQYDDITAPAPPKQYIRSSHPSTEAVDDTLLDDTSPSVCQVSPAILPCRRCGRVGHNRATCRNLL